MKRSLIVFCALIFALQSASAQLGNWNKIVLPNFNEAKKTSLVGVAI